MSKRRDMDRFLRELKRAGYQISLTGGTHWMIKDSQGRFVTTTGTTPGGGRGLLNLRATIKRHERLERSTP